MKVFMPLEQATKQGLNKTLAESYSRLHSFGRQGKLVIKHPWRFCRQVFKSFRENQGFLLASAIAYNALLSIVPLLILTVIALSHLVDQVELLQTLTRYLEWLMPGQSKSIVTELASFLEHRESASWVLLASMLFFSSLAFTVLENSMSVIFHHRVIVRRRRYIVSVLIPYIYIVSLGIGLLVVTIVAASLQAIGLERLHILGLSIPLAGFSGFLLYLVGVGGEVLVLTSIYLVMPVGKLSIPFAVLGALVATLFWEISRHLLVWYFATISQISTVYGSLTAAIAILLSLEVAATLLLIGAQVIAEFERFDNDAINVLSTEFSTKRLGLAEPVS
jgi:membrane protein